MVSKNLRQILAKTTSVFVFVSIMSTGMQKPENVLAEENNNIVYSENTSGGIVLDKSEAVIVIGNALKLSANVSSDDSVVWESSDTKIATVDENGSVTAVGLGQAVITATTKVGGQSASCKIRVRDKYNIIANGDFELGTTGWTGTRAANISLDSGDSFFGKNSLLVSKRKETGAGPIQDVTGKMKKGETYDISFYVKYETGPDVKTFNATMEMPNFKYQILITGEAKKGEWTKVQGKYTVTDDLSQYQYARIFIETPWKSTPDPVEDWMDFKVDNIQILSNEVVAPVVKINNIDNGSVYNRRKVVPDIYVDDKDAVVTMKLNGQNYDGSPISTPGNYELVVTADNGKLVSKSVTFKITSEYPQYAKTELNNPIVTYRYTADPAVMTYNGRFYIYTSADSQYGGNTFDDLDVTVCLSSDDMVNWKYEGDVFRAKKDTTWASMAWAPAAIERDGKFYLYFANGGGGIGVAVSDSPTGPFKDEIGKPLIKSDASLNTNVPWIFDPAAFIDDDGQAYLYFGGSPSKEGEPCNARVIKLKDNMVETEGKAVTIEIPEFFEALWMNKIGDKYYLSYASSYATTTSRIDYMTSDDPMTGFKYEYGVSNRTILANPPDNNGGNNHASIAEFEGKWYIIYHSRTLAKANGVNGDSRRSVAIDKMEFNQDGSIKKVTPTTKGVEQIKGFDPYRDGNRSVMSRQFGVKLEEGNDRQKFISASDDSWLLVKGVDFSQGTSQFEAMLASTKSGGKIELRLDSLDGTSIGTLNVDETGDLENWKKQSIEVSNVKGNHDLYMVFSGESEQSFNLADWKFIKSTSTDIPVTDINEAPTITAEDITLTLGDEFNPLKDVIANDTEDGDITNKIEIVENAVNLEKVGEYKIVYKVVDSKGATFTKSRAVKIVAKADIPGTDINEVPTIIAEDITLTLGDKFNPLKDVIANDTEDGDITDKIEIVENTVNLEKAGEYKIVYKVVDSKGATVTKSRAVKIVAKEDDKSEVISVSGVSFEKKELTIKVDEVLELKVKVNPENATNKNVTWSSSNESVVKVDKDGKITALSEGKAIITVKTKDGEFTDTCIVNVNKKVVVTTNNNNALPQTGNENYLLALVFGALSIIVGKFTFIKKKKVIK